MPQIRVISGHEVRKSLTVLLKERQDDSEQALQRALSFENMASTHNYDLNRQVVVSNDDEIIFSTFLMPQKGGSAFVFISDPSSLSLENREMALEALSSMIENSRDQDYTFLQLMVGPEEIEKIKLANEAGFICGSQIHYMYRSINSRIGIVRIPPGVSWLMYSEKNHKLFADVIERSWIDSLDCPGMTGYRTVEQTIESYKSAGVFTRTFWSMILIDDNPAGVCLLSPLGSGQSIELTYTGVVPEARGKGLGKIMLNRAISLSAIDGYKIMTLAVDDKNLYAMDLYEKSGFKNMFTKVAMIYTFQATIDSYNCSRLP